MTTSSISKIWDLIEKYSEEIDLLGDMEALVLLVYISRHKGFTRIGLTEKVKKNIPAYERLLDLLLEKGFIVAKNDRLNISDTGKDIVRAVEFSRYDITDLPREIIDGYMLEHPALGIGSTSVTYKATIKKTRREVVLKVFRPGLLNHIDLGRKIRKINSLRSSFIVIPDDWGEFRLGGISLKYLLMEYVEGDTLRTFLEKMPGIDLKETLRNFIREVGGTLKKLKDNGFIHGDLHSNNILTVEEEFPEYQNQRIIHFKIIDFIGVTSSEEFRKYEKSDFEYLKENFLRIVRKYGSTPSGEIDIKKLGERFINIYRNLIENSYTSIESVIDGLSQEIPKRKKLVVKHPFTYLIFETFDVEDPEWLNRFEPNSKLYGTYAKFGPLICSGPRGCGKTIYLRSLSFIPKLIRRTIDDTSLQGKIAYNRGIFGIYFPCRQGEFKYFSDKQYDFTNFRTQLFLKHILVLKIIRRTVTLISEAYEEKVFTSDPKLEKMLMFLYKYILSDINLTRSAKKKPFKELSSILRNIEDNSIDVLGLQEKYQPVSKLLNENNLIEFFEIAKQTVTELGDQKFYVIFDDVSEPQVNIEVQKLLNSLMACHNSIYCCKFSTDKYAYTFVDMFGKALQMPHDYGYIDMSDIDNYEGYLETIINRQLEMTGYSGGIKEYLEPLPYNHQKLIDLLSIREYKKVKYAGWKMLVHLSSWSVREGLAFCDSIFEQYGGSEEHDKLKKLQDVISFNTQNDGISKYSEKVYGSLINIESVGKKIFDFTRTFGEVSRKYLEKQITEKKERKYEMITIVRRDSQPLNKEAEQLLGKLIRHSVFLDKGFSFSRDQIGLVQKFTLNKKYAPKLRTTFREREHLRLSKNELEEFLLNPDRFLKITLIKHEFQLKQEFQLELFNSY